MTSEFNEKEYTDFISKLTDEELAAERLVERAASGDHNLTEQKRLIADAAAELVDREIAKRKMQMSGEADEYTDTFENVREIDRYAIVKHIPERTRLFNEIRGLSHGIAELESRLALAQEQFASIDRSFIANTVSSRYTPDDVKRQLVEWKYTWEERGKDIHVKFNMSPMPEYGVPDYARDAMGDVIVTEAGNISIAVTGVSGLLKCDECGKDISIKQWAISDNVCDKPLCVGCFHKLRQTTKKNGGI
jgi:hypothetical protein